MKQKGKDSTAKGKKRMNMQPWRTTQYILIYIGYFETEPGKEGPFKLFFWAFSTLRYKKHMMRLLLDDLFMIYGKSSEIKTFL